MSETATVEKVRERVLQLNREIESLSRSEVPPEDFFPQFLDKLVKALGADAGAVWMLEDGQRLGLKAETGLDAIGFRQNPNAAAQNQPLLLEVMSTGQAAVYVPGETEKPLPAPHQIIVAALQTGSESAGVVQIFQRAGAPKEARPGYLQFVEQMCGYGSRYLERQKNRTETSLGESAASPFLYEFGDFVLQMQRTLDSKEVCSTAASDGRLLLNCDRVSVVLTWGRRTFVQAISGQDSVNKRANLVRTMVALAKTVIAMKEPLVYSGKNEALPPQVETPLADFVQESKSRLVMIVPLFETELLIQSDDDDEDPARTRAAKKSDRIIGCLVIEQFRSSEPAPNLQERVDLIADHVAAALHNAREHERIIFLPLWKGLGRISEWFHGRKLLKTLAVLAGIVLVVLALVFVPWDYRVEGEGQLMPVEQRQVYAQVDGEVIQVLAEGGAHVAKGQPLIKLKNDELHTQLLAARSELTEKQQLLRTLNAQISEASRNSEPEEKLRLQGQMLATKIEITGLEEQIEIYKDREAHLIVRSPMDGVLATFQVEQKLQNRPVKRGDALVEVMDENGPWRLELEVEEHRLGHIFEGQQKLHTEHLPVEFVLATRPESTYTGSVQDIATRADVAAEKGTIVEVLTKINADDLPLDRRRIGAEVRAKINCGKSSLGYVLFGDVIEFVQKHWWRWL